MIKGNTIYLHLKENLLLLFKNLLSYYVKQYIIAEQIFKLYEERK